MQGLEAVYHSLRPQLLRFLQARTGNASDAEDILQDMWLKLSEVKGVVGNPAAYLHRMANNAALDKAREHSRKRRRDQQWAESQTSYSGADPVDEAPSAERLLMSREACQRVAEIIAGMPPAAARVFRLHRIEGLTHAEVASQLGISRSGVEKAMATALRYLAKGMTT